MNLYDELREHYVNAYPADAARIVEQQLEQTPGLDTLSTEGFTRLLEYLDPGCLKAMFLSLDEDRRAAVLQRTSIRTAMQILRSLSDSELTAALDSLPPRVRNEYKELLECPARTAGRFMDRLVARYRTDQTVGEALAELRRSKAQRLRSL